MATSESQNYVSQLCVVHFSSDETCDLENQEIQRSEQLLQLFRSRKNIGKDLEKIVEKRLAFQTIGYSDSRVRGRDVKSMIILDRGRPCSLIYLKNRNRDRPSSF